MRTRFFLILPILVMASFLGGCDSNEEKGELIVTDLAEGDGAVVQRGQTLTVSYVGRFSDGTIFDSTAEKGENFTFTFGVGQVLEGWDEGLTGIRVGGERRLEIPSHMAFGRQGQCFSDGSCAVPPNTDVTYDVTVLEIFDYVRIEDVQPGDGRIAEFADIVFVEYVGTLPAYGDQVFDASNSRPEDFFFTIGGGGVISGFEQGVIGMRVGGVREILIPPVLGYGGFGAGSAVPPWAVLKFNIELVRIVKPGE
ncbi:MAG: FKBP-type peptidyl-prolyl cis-trans isomerase [Rhodothermales bacterium]